MNVLVMDIVGLALRFSPPVSKRLCGYNRARR
jgi:hypothetical protein